MAEFLDGIEQGGGGLTTVADVTVSGGAVTEMSSGAITLVDGGVYMVSTYVIQSGAGSPSFGLTAGGDTTAANYKTYGQHRSASTSTQSNATFVFNTCGTATADGAKCYAGILLRVVGTSLFFYGQNAGTGAVRQFITSWTYDSGTLPTSITVLSSVASKIGDTSNLKIVRLY